jgi:subtilase family serine protease
VKAILQNLLALIPHRLMGIGNNPLFGTDFAPTLGVTSHRPIRLGSSCWMHFFLILTSVIVVIPHHIQAQEVAPQRDVPFDRPQITAAIDDSSIVRVPNSQPRLLEKASDLGRMDRNATLKPLFLILKSNSEKHRALQSLLDRQQDKSTSSFHEWLTPDEFGEKFGANASDLEALTHWLAIHGFTVGSVSLGRRSITFSGTVAQVEETFHTEMHTYLFNGERHFSNKGDIAIPAAFSDAVEGIASLNDMWSRPHSAPIRRVKLAEAAAQQLQPDYTGANGSSHYLSPGDFATIYNTTPLLQQQIDGNGQTIAIIGDSSSIQENDQVIEAFRALFLPTYNANNTNVFIVPTSTTCPAPAAGDNGEAYLDTEWAGAVAPRATIAYFASANIFCAMNQAVQSNIASVLSMSFSACELDLGSVDYTFVTDLWSQAAAQGTSVFVSAGDSGSAGCDNPHTEQISGGSYAVNGYASTPYNIAVGGTEFADGVGTYWSASNKTPLLPYTSALGYIPEEAWNESATVSGGSGIWAGGGGISQCVPQPSWQTGPGVPSGTDPISLPSVTNTCPSVTGQHRYLPDVSLSAAEHDGYLICVTTNGCSSVGFSPSIANGTSAAAPAFAGIQTLIDEQYGRQGQANYVYYQLAANDQSTNNCNSTASNGPSSACIFNDIRGGNNGVPCLQGSVDCVVVGTTSGGVIYELANFNAGAGYDLASGLGSVNAYNLVQQWNNATFRSTTTTLQVTSPASGVSTFGQSVTLSATVYVPSAQASSQNWGPPLAGTLVTFRDTTTSVQLGTAPLVLSSSTSDFVATFTTTSLPVGSNSVTAQFPGSQNGGYGSSTSTPQIITVTAAVQAPTATTAPATLVSSTNATLNGTVNPNGSATQYTFVYGTSQTLVGAASTGTYGIGAGTSPQAVSANAPGLSAGKTYYYQLQASNSAGSNDGNILNFMTTSAGKATPTVLVSPLSSSITTAQPLSVVVTVSTTSGNPSPTGTVTLVIGNYTSSATTLANASATINIPAGSLAAGKYTPTATYSGDNNFNGASGSATSMVTVTAPAKITPTVLVSPLSSSITTAQPLSVVVTVSTTSGNPSPTGTVTLVIGNYTSSATTLINASVTINIPAGSLGAGMYTPTATYSGDNNFNGASGSAPSPVTVTGGATATLTVVVTGSGTVNSTDSHINCPGTCSYAYAVGASVTLNANEASGYYDQWTGCDGILSNSCLITISQSRTVSIVFTKQITSTLSVLPASLVLSPQVIGTSSTGQNVFMNNTGSAGLDPVTVSISGPNSSDFAMTNYCPGYGLNPGNQCYATVTFTPSGIGIRTASLTVSCANATSPTQVVPLSGSGVINPTVLVTPSSSSISTTQMMTVTVSVNGSDGTPTGSLRLNGGGYNLPGISLIGGNASINIPAGSLATGSDPLYVYYTPDVASSSIYNYASGTATVTVAPASSYTAPSEPVGTSGSVQTATISLSGSFTLGSVAVVTQGVPNLDFNYAPGGTCVVGTQYTAGQTCTVNFTFKPTVPGTRMGAINMFDNTLPMPVLQATVFLNGVGTGPLADFLPGTQSAIGSGLYDPYGVAVDGGGSLYISDTSNNRVLKETLSAGSYVQSIIGGGMTYPDGVAVDGSGNVYIADTGNSRVLMETLSGGSYIQSTIGSGLSNPDGVAVDGSGNVYIADTGNSRVLMETLSGGSYIQSTVASNGLNVPTGVAVDGNGNVYIADDFNDRVLMEALSVSGYTQSIIASGLNHPYSVAVDGADNVYIADSYNNRILKETLSAGSYTQTTIGSGLNTPLGVTVDGSGNVYIADTNNSRMLKVDMSDPPSLHFASTASGSTSSDSPQTVTFVNNGNAQLTLSIPQSGNNPSISINFTLNSTGGMICPLIASTSSSAGALATGTSCTLPISFTPTGIGALSGSLILTDNNLNVTNLTQTISLSGTAAPATVGTTTTLASSLNPSVYGQSVTITATVAQASGPAVPTGTVQFSIDGNIIGSAVMLTGGTAAYATTTLGAGTHNITGVYMPTSGTAFTASSATAFSQVVKQATPAITWATPAAITYGTALSAAQLDATSTVAGTFAYSPTIGAVLTAGSQTLSTTFMPTDTTDYTTGTDTVQLTVNKAMPTITWATPATVTVGTALSSAQLDATASVPGTFVYSPTIGTVMSTAGSATLSTTFTPTDNTDYNNVSATVVLTVSPAPTFAIAGTAVSVAPGATTGNTSIITVTPSNGFTGTVSLSCAITPTAANDPATCSIPASVTISGTTAQTAMLTVNTTAATTALNHPKKLFWPSADEAALALVLFFGIPAQRRSWRSMFGTAVLLVLISCVVLGCGSSSGRGGNPGTTAGTYTVTVTGISGVTTTTGTVTLTVQ